MSVAVNIRNIPESLMDYRAGKNHLNYERITFPMTTDFTLALKRNIEQMNEYKNSQRDYVLYYFLKIFYIIMPKSISDSERSRLTLSLLTSRQPIFRGPVYPSDLELVHCPRVSCF